MEEKIETPNAIATGTGDGLFAFLDFLVEKGYSSRPAVDPWKSASRRILSTMEGESFGATDLRSFDIDGYFDRFENRVAGQYKNESLAAYRARFRRAVEAYRAYLLDKSIPQGRTRATRSEKPPKKKVSTPDSPTPNPVAGGAELLSYPLPLPSGPVAYLSLPRPLSEADKAMINSFLDVLVPTESKPQLDQAKAPSRGGGTRDPGQDQSS